MTVVAESNGWEVGCVTLCTQGKRIDGMKKKLNRLSTFALIMFSMMLLSFFILSRHVVIQTEQTFLTSYSYFLCETFALHVHANPNILLMSINDAY